MRECPTHGGICRDCPRECRAEPRASRVEHVSAPAARAINKIVEAVDRAPDQNN